MPGFESYNTATGTFQVDGVFKNYVLVRVVDVVAGSETLSGIPVSVRVAATPISQGEIVAIRCAYPAAVASVSAGVLKVHLGKDNVPSGAVVTCYFFAPITTSDATSGLQVFHEVTGDLLFCATKKPIRIVQVLNDHGDFVLDTSRTYATILLNQYYRLFTGGFNQNGQGTKVVEAQRSMVSPLSTGLRVASTIEMFGAGFSGSPGEYVPDALTVSNAGVAKHLVIDVTGYA